MDTITNPPCATHPDDYIQPGENHDWHTTPAAKRALATCQTCPHTTACARAALTAGTITIDGCTIQACADGVIMAGMVCRGDISTRRHLNSIINPASGASHCAACNRLFRTTNQADGQVRHRRDGLCHGCWKAEQRTGMGVAATQRAPAPAECVTCHTPMVPWGHDRPPGHVNHSSNGRCKRCAKAHARRAAA